MARRTSLVLWVSVAGVILLLACVWSSGAIAPTHTSDASAESACSTTRKVIANAREGCLALSTNRALE